MTTRRPPIAERIHALRAALLTEPDPSRAAHHLMSLVADPALARDADRVEHPPLADHLWTLLAGADQRADVPPPGAPIAMERYAPAGVLLGFVPVGLRPAGFVYFEDDAVGLLVAPGRADGRHLRFSLAAAPARQTG
ncbi:MAG: hypothetical protein R3F65_12245 [bacterium]|nr:hypothetical protein [Myxococcales bacterium]MCB9553908.1 hypothetical protein [Myxococcales bacterium]